MPRYAVAVNNFNSGELSPHLYGRADLAKWKSGAELVQNMICLAEGGLIRRSGTHYVTTTHTSTVRSRLIPFIFSNEQAYVLEFAEQRMRVFADEGIVLVPTFTFADADVNTTTDEINEENHGYVDGQGPVRFTNSGGALPTGITAGTDYTIDIANSDTFVDGDVAVSPTDQITLTSHGYTDEMGPFRLTTTGAIPAGLLYNTDYYIRFVDANTVELSLTAGGAKVAITAAAGSGTHTLEPTADYKRDYFRLQDGGSPVDITAAAGGGVHTLDPDVDGDGEADFALEAVVPYSESELAEVQYAQSADVLYLVHPNHPPHKISRTSNTAWAIDEVDLIDGPYLPENSTTTTLAPSFTSGNDLTLTASDTVGINGGDGFSESDIGRRVRMLHGAAGNEGWGIIAGYVSPTVVEIYSRDDFHGTGAITEWRLGAWYPGNYPKAITFFEQRLAMAGEAATPETLHASVTGDFETFSPNTLDGSAVQDDSALNYIIGSNQVNSIEFLAYVRNLVVGTNGSLFSVQASTNQEAITPTNVNVRRDWATGAKAIVPVNIANRVLYVSRTGRKFQSIRYSFDTDSNVADDMTILADHISETGLLELQYADERENVAWVLREDGLLLGFTLVPDQEVTAWHRHPLGGDFDGKAAVVESIAVIPSQDESHDQLWMTVKRTINGATARYVEFMGKTFRSMSDGSVDRDDAWFVDSGLRREGANTTDPVTIENITAADPPVVTATAHGYVDNDEVRITHVCGMTEVNRQVYRVLKIDDDNFSLRTLAGVGVVGAGFTAYTTGGEVRKRSNVADGLDHLEGQTVAVLADGAAHPDRTVSGGSITLDANYSEVVVGLPFTSTYRSLALRPPDPLGASLGRIQHISELHLLFHDTIGGKIGPDVTKLDWIQFRGPGDPMNQGPELFSDVKRQEFHEGYDRTMRIVVQQDQPLPMTLTSMNILGRGGDR